MSKRFFRAVLAAPVLLGLAAPAALAQEENAPPAAVAQAETPRLDLLSGRSQLFATGGHLERVAISNPKVASVRVINNKQIMVQGLAPGATTLMVWTKGGGARSFDVNVSLDASQVEKQVRQITGNDGFRVAYNGKSWLLSGAAASMTQREAAEKIVAATGQPVVNLIQMPPRREQIAIDVHVVELSKTAMLNFGYTIGGGEVTGIQNGVRQYIFKPGEMMMGELAPGGFPNNLGGLDFLAAKLEALQRRGEAKLLARPTLVTVDGGTAKFLAGGEIPIPVQQALGVTTILWKEFGVRLEIQPTMSRGGTITLAVKPEVSSLDYASGLKQAAFTIPAIKTRRAETTVALAPTETLMLGGLMSNEENRSWDGLPLLADIPIIGELFRSRRWMDNQTELAILVTPRLVPAGEPANLPGRLPEVNRDLGREMAPKKR